MSAGIDYAVLSPDNSILVYNNRSTGTLHFLCINGLGDVDTNEPSPLQQPAWSPDSSYLVGSHLGTKGRNADIIKIIPSGPVSVFPLTKSYQNNDQTFREYPVAGADNSVYYQSKIDGKVEIYRVAGTGLGVETLLTPDVTRDSRPVAYGDYLFYTRHQSSGISTGTYFRSTIGEPLGNTLPLSLASHAPAGNSYLSVSPAGDKVAWKAWQADERDAIYIADSTGLNRYKLYSPSANQPIGKPYWLDRSTLILTIKTASGPSLLYTLSIAQGSFPIRFLAAGGGENITSAHGFASG